MTAAGNKRRSISLLSLLLAPICSSFTHLSPFARVNRERTFRRLRFHATTKSEDTNEDGSNADERPPSSFESMVRNVTGRKDYRFGDLTKEAVSTTTHAVEDLAKATHLVDDDYHFGDITKGAISSLSKPVASAMSSAEHTLSLVREANIHEFVALTNIIWKDNLSDDQREQIWIVGIHLAAIMVLAYNFISNLQGGIVTAVACTRACLQMGVSPLASPANWARFLNIQSSLNMVFGGPFLPARAIITIKFFFPYRRLLVRMQQISPLRQKYPLLNKVVSVLAMWLVVNLAFVGLLTSIMVWIGSLFTGVSVFSASA